jgi:RNA polymerase sigma factor (TIGR02999 family)
MSDVTCILSRIESGDQLAAEELLPLVYGELRKRAQSMMARERSDHTLQATALVHDAYIRLVDAAQVQHWNSRGHFYSAAAEAMRRILIESAVRKKSVKRGGDRQRIELGEDLAATMAGSNEELIDFNELLDRLSVEDSNAAELVKLRLFAGLSIEEAGNMLGMSRSVAYENWKFARAWFACQEPVSDG